MDNWLHDWYERKSVCEKYAGVIQADICGWHYWCIYFVDTGFPHESKKPYIIEYLWVNNDVNITEFPNNPTDCPSAFGVPGIWVEHSTGMLVDLLIEKIKIDRKGKGFEH